MPYTNGWEVNSFLSSMAQRCHYSNYGPGIILSAPSSNYHTYGRESSIGGLHITTVKGSSVNEITTRFGGTSSATALVAGIAALVISANPDLSALEVISVLKNTAWKGLNFKKYKDLTSALKSDPNPRGTVGLGACHNAQRFVWLSCLTKRRVWAA